MRKEKRKHESKEIRTRRHSSEGTLASAVACFLQFSSDGLRGNARARPRHGDCGMPGPASLISLVLHTGEEFSSVFMKMPWPRLLRRGEHCSANTFSPCLASELAPIVSQSSAALVTAPTSPSPTDRRLRLIRYRLEDSGEPLRALASPAGMDMLSSSVCESPGPSLPRSWTSAASSAPIAVTEIRRRRFFIKESCGDGGQSPSGASVQRASSSN